MYSGSLDRYYEILELDPEASLSDIRSAYLQLKELYSNESIVTFPIEDDFTDASRKEILHQIEVAYTKLKALFENEDMDSEQQTKVAAVFDNGLKREIENIESFSGPILKDVREKLGIDLFEVSDATKIRTHQLENVEQENFHALPPEVFIKGFVSAYAKYLSLDSDKVVHDYMTRYQVWKRTPKVKF